MERAGVSSSPPRERARARRARARSRVARVAASRRGPTSARVGRGFFCIVSSICVATMTGLPTALHFSTIIFCAIVTSVSGISTPRSPRATMMPSDAARIASKLSIA